MLGKDWRQWEKGIGWWHHQFNAMWVCKLRVGAGLWRLHAAVHGVTVRLWHTEAIELRTYQKKEWISIRKESSKLKRALCSHRLREFVVINEHVPILNIKFFSSHNLLFIIAIRQKLQWQRIFFDTDIYLSMNLLNHKFADFDTWLNFEVDNIIFIRENKLYEYITQVQ